MFLVSALSKFGQVAAGSRTALNTLSKGATEAGDAMWKQV